MSDAPFSVCLIVRNCAKILDRCLASVAPMGADEIVIVNTAASKDEEGYEETSAVAEGYGAKVFDFPWNGSFADARNHAFDRCSHDLVMWIDSDDEVRNPIPFAKAIRAMGRSDHNVLGVPYFYEFAAEPDKSPCTTTLIRERVVKRSQFYWKSPIHEVLLAKTQLIQQSLSPSEGYVFQHLTKGADMPALQAKLERNIKIFESKWPDGNCETRMLFYWGNTLLGLGRFQEALDKYQANLKRKDGSKHERHIVICSSSETLRMMGRNEQALIAANMAVTDNPLLPTGWIQKAQAHFCLGHQEAALQAAKTCEMQFEHLAGENVSNPAELRCRPSYIRAHHAFYFAKDLDKAVHWCSKALSSNPYDKRSQDLRAEIQTALDAQRAEASFNAVCEGLQSVDPDLAEKVAESAPMSVRTNPSMQRFWQIPDAPVTPRVAIVCGAIGIKGFDHSSLVKGISGSEEAVVHVGNEFDRRGWSVDVYNERPFVTEIPDKKIRYIPYPCWQDTRPYDLVIYWRTGQLVHEMPTLSGCPKFLWMHDAIPMNRMWHQYWKAFDRVMCLSKFHAKTTGLEDAENLMITRNGIDVASMPDPKNDMDRVVWPSDPYRGIPRLASMWDALKEVRPNLKLDILYGFSEKYEAAIRLELSQGITEYRDIKVVTETFAKRDDVTLHGMVPQARCHELMARAGWWLYPTDFPEISCITAMKAQALGCRIVCSDDFALSETVKWGRKVPRGEDFEERFLDAAMAEMRDPSQMDAMVKEGIEWGKTLGWGSVVDQWLEAAEKCKEKRRVALSMS